MADFLSGGGSGDGAYSLLSLINALYPKPAYSGGSPLCQRRRDVLPHLLKHSSRLTTVEKRRNSDNLVVGLGGWPELPDDTSLEDSGLMLTAALDAGCLAELRADNLDGTSADNAAMSRFVLRQAQEGAVAEAQEHARRLLALEKSGGAQTVVRQTNAAFCRHDNSAGQPRGRPQRPCRRCPAAGGPRG